jgi:formate-dependent nitrite reductase membrane component NrfD
MIVFLVLAVVLAVPTVVGFVRIRRQRHADRKHFAAFIGFGAAVLAITILIVNLAHQWWLGPVNSRYISDASKDVIAVSSIIQHLSTLVAFSAGFFSARPLANLPDCLWACHFLDVCTLGVLKLRGLNRIVGAEIGIKCC